MRPPLPLRLAALVPALVPAALSAQTLVPWGSVGGWDVLVDPKYGRGCLVESVFTNGSTVRIGLAPSIDAGYLEAFNRGWGGIDEGATYAVGFALDRELYQGDAEAVYLDGVPGVQIVFDDPEFLYDIAARNTLRLYTSTDGEVMAIDLAGSAAAIEAMLACQEEQ